MTVHLIEKDSTAELFAAACADLLAGGTEVSPRGMLTREILGAELCLTMPRCRLIGPASGRLINPAFAVAEALWILSGSDGSWIFGYNRALHQYADRGTLQGAYGPRIRRWAGVIDQLDHVRRTLETDPASRQGVVQIYDPVRDTRGHRDVPCTLNYRFYVRDGRLDMHTTMRSQDVWLGLPYDLFTVTVIQELMAGWLGVAVGVLRHTVDSLHLYKQHFDAAGVVPADLSASEPMGPLAVAWENLDDVLAAVITDGNLPQGTAPMWSTFAKVLASYRAWTSGDRSGARDVASAVTAHGEDEGAGLGRTLLAWYDHLDAARAEKAGAAA